MRYVVVNIPMRTHAQKHAHGSRTIFQKHIIGALIKHVCLGVIIH